MSFLRFRVVFSFVLFMLLLSLALVFTKSQGAVILYFEISNYTQETVQYTIRLDDDIIKTETISYDFPYMFLEEALVFEKGITSLHLTINDSIELHQSIFLYRDTTFLKVMVNQANEISLAQSRKIIIYQ